MKIEWSDKLEKSNKVEMFIYMEKLLFKLTIFLFGMSILLFILTFVIYSYLEGLVETLYYTVFILFISTGINFCVSLFRILKYSVNIKVLQNENGIWRSLIGLFLNPVTFVILYILLIMISFASCSIN